MERYVFIDETGDLGEHGSKFFVSTAIWIDKPHEFDRLIKNMRRYKFEKLLKGVQEIKSNKSSPELIEHILKKFAETSAHAQSVILEKNKVYSKYLKEDKHKLYNFVTGHLSNIAIDSKKLIIRIDRSKGKQSLIDDFNNYLEIKFKELKWNREIEVHHSWSQSWVGLQIADVVSYAVFQKFEHEKEHYFKLIEKKVNIAHMWDRK